MIELFQRGYLRDYLDQRIRASINLLDRKTDDEVLSRSLEDVVQELAHGAQVTPLSIGTDLIDGGVVEGVITVPDGWSGGDMVARSVFNLHAVYEFEGNQELLHYRPSTSLAYTRIEAEVGVNTLTVRTVVLADSRLDPDAARRSIEREIDKIRANAAYAGDDVAKFNSSAAGRLRPAVERRQALIMSKRALAGALGFPLQKRGDAPSPVPLQRKVVGVRKPAVRSNRSRYEDEWALTDSQYEDAIQVITSAMLSMERTPSVVAAKDEEELRDYILVMLNGTFQGTATGETFVKNGKTDILIRVEDRHVFVGECKWWRGAKALGAAVDQLLGYLPWRDEKAALIVFIDNKDASVVFEKVDHAIKSHGSYKRAGKSSASKTRRQDFILGHPEDPEREIQLAVLFAVLPKSEA